METNSKILQYQEYLNKLPADTDKQIQRKLIAMQTLTEFIYTLNLKK